MMAYLFGFTVGLCEIQCHQIVPETRVLDGFQALFGGPGGFEQNVYDVDLKHKYSVQILAGIPFGIPPLGNPLAQVSYGRIS